MKWTIPELRKLSRTLHQFQGVIDCKRYISEDEQDILDISPVEIKGEFHLIESENIYVFDCDVSCMLSMPCAITLKEIEVPLHFQTTIEFAEKFVDDNTHLIDGITIDLDPVIYSEILIEKPMRVVAKDAYQDYHEEEIHLDEEDVSNNPFAALKNRKY